MLTITPSRDLLQSIIGEQKLNDVHPCKVQQLKDFLEKCLMLDPAKLNQALITHRFITEKV